MKNDLLRYISKFMVCCLVCATMQMPAFASTGSGNGATTINETISITESGQVSDCAGGVVSFTLSGNIIIRGVENQNGAEVKEGISVHITGTNQDGVPYVGSETANISEHFNAGETITEVVNVHINGQGTAPNITAKILIHITVNANGTVTVSNETASGCLGN